MMQQFTGGGSRSPTARAVLILEAAWKRAKMLVSGRALHPVGTTMDQNTSAKVMKSYMCVVCGFVYDEEQGLPEDGIAPGTRWEDIPETWTCPDCGASKDEFELIEI